MVEFFVMMFYSPEAQYAPHYWATTMLAHALLGVMIPVFIGQRLAVLGYLLWELASITIAGAGLADSALDAASFILGTYLMVMLYNGRKPYVTVAAIAIVAAVGVLVRLNHV